MELELQLFPFNGRVRLETLEKVFAFNLRKARGKRTQAEMAEQLDATLASYQRWESGKFIPQPETRAQIALKLGVPETSLFIDPDLSSPTAEQIVDVLSEALENSSFRASLAQALEAYMPVVRKK